MNHGAFPENGSSFESARGCSSKRRVSEGFRHPSFLQRMLLVDPLLFCRHLSLAVVVAVFILVAAGKCGGGSCQHQPCGQHSKHFFHGLFFSVKVIGGASETNAVDLIGETGNFQFRPTETQAIAVCRRPEFPKPSPIFFDSGQQTGMKGLTAGRRASGSQSQWPTPRPAQRRCRCPARKTARLPGSPTIPASHGLR